MTTTLHRLGWPWPIRAALRRKRAAPARLAVLIDADNISARIAQPLFESLPTTGMISVCRAYANLKGPQSNAWSHHAKKHGIELIHVPNVTKGKNASDIAICVDAMDLLHQGVADAFCLISSDADFTGLAMRIRAAGLLVYGYGHHHTPSAFRCVCTRFVFIEHLDTHHSASEIKARERWTREPHEAEDLVLRAVVHLGGQRHSVTLSELGSYLVQLDPSFDPRTYRSRTLSHLIGSLSSLELVEGVGGYAVRAQSTLGDNSQRTRSPRRGWG